MSQLLLVATFPTGPEIVGQTGPEWELYWEALLAIWRGQEAPEALAALS